MMNLVIFFLNQNIFDKKDYYYLILLLIYILRILLCK